MPPEKLCGYALLSCKIIYSYDNIIEKTKRGSMSKLRTIDLFAGIGGIRLGFESTGAFETVWANDFEPKCKLTYDLNFKETPLTVADITKVDVRKFLLAFVRMKPFTD